MANLATFMPLVMGIIYYKCLPLGIKYLPYFFSFVLARDITTLIYGVYRLNNLYLYNLSAILEAIFFSYIFYLSINKTQFRKGIAIILLIVLITDIFFWMPDDFSPIILTLTRVVEIIVTLLYFIELISDLKASNILVHSYFWLSSGLMLQASGTFFVSLFSSVVLSKVINHADFNYYWNVNLIMYILFCFFATTSFWVSKYEYVIK
ncbi:hypothetical protein [Tellurirhabdus bombi]|uniref:hypothetical protein n=1 Tax=Tellurirhabdus bombi TaxID=2907205 RepID=UPI001F3F0C85|nr:hypothetical protein [Tellurirhabdus bombi]